MARRFTNGTTDEIDFGSFAALEGVGAATFAVWLKKRTADDYFSHLLCKTASGPDGMNLMHGASGFGDDGIYASVSLAGTEGDLYINTVFTVDVWYHVALRFDGSQTGNDRLHLYINGAQQSVSRGLTTYPATIGGSGANLRIGGTDHETDVRPSDDIAWAAVWLSALSGTTIGYLAAGRNPMNYSPAFCAPLKGDSPEVDLVGGVSGSVTGTSSVSGPAIDPWLSLPSMSSITATTGVPRVTLTF